MTAAWPGGAPEVGDVAELSRTVTPTDIQRFTEISGDHNPLHYDLASATDADVLQRSRLGPNVFREEFNGGWVGR